MSEKKFNLSNRNFEYILAIAEEKTVQAAAEKLYISQPSLSRFVKNLENRIDVKLFDRIDNRLILTPAGKQYVALAKKVSDMEHSIEKLLIQLQNEQHMYLRVGIPDHWASYFIPPLVNIVQNFLPEIKLEIADVRSSALEPMLLRGEVDLIIFRKPLNNESFTSLFLREDPLYLAVPDKLASSIKTLGLNSHGIPIVDPRELAELNYILPYEGRSFRRQIDLLFENLNITPHTIFTCRSVTVSMRMAGDAIGCCFVSETHRRHHGLGTPPCFLAIEHPAAMLSLHLSYARNRMLPKYIMNYIELIRNIL